IPTHWSPVARVVASQNFPPAPSARARRITACDSRESSKLNLQANSPLGPKIGKFDYLSAPGHSAHSMASEFFTEDFLAGASSGMRTSADASVHAHGPSSVTTHASVIDLVLSMEKVSVRSTLA